MRDSTRDSLCIHAIALTESALEQPLRQLRLRGELSGWGPLRADLRSPYDFARNPGCDGVYAGATA